MGPKLIIEGPILERPLIGGEKVRGTLIVKCDALTFTRSITVKLWGKEMVSITRRDVRSTYVGGASAVVASRVRSRTFRDSFLPINRFYVCLGAKLGEASGSPKLQLEAGEHRFDFFFTLPPELPGTMKKLGLDYEISVRYFIEARLDMPGHIMDTTKKLRIHAQGNHMESQHLLSLLRKGANAEESKSFIMSEGRLGARAQLPCSALVCGETVPIHLQFNNDTTVPMSCVRLKLHTFANITAEGQAESVDLGSGVVGTISAISGPEAARHLVVGPRESANHTLQFRVPWSSFTTHETARLKTTHFLEVELVPQGWYHTNLRMTLQVQVLAPTSEIIKAIRSMEGKPASPCPQVPHTKVVAGPANAPESELRRTLQEAGGNHTSLSSSGQTALHLACARKKPTLVRALIRDGSDPFTTTTAGLTALHVAAFHGDAATCTAVLEECPANRVAELKAAKSNAGSTAAQICAREISGAVPSPADHALARLITDWVTPKQMKADDEAASIDLQVAISQVGESVHSTTEHGHTALHLACLRGQEELARALICAGSDIFATTNAGFTALHSAAYGNDTSTCVAVLMACPLEKLGKLKGATTKKASTAAIIARAQIDPPQGAPSPSNPKLARLIEEWAPAEVVTQLSDEGDDADLAGDQVFEAELKDGCEELLPAMRRTSSAPDASAGTSTDPRGPEARLSQSAEPKPRLPCSVAPAPCTAEVQPKPGVVKMMRLDEATSCTVCQAPFSLLNWRHHCNGCGTLVCNKCAPKESRESHSAGRSRMRTCVQCKKAVSPSA